VNTHRRTLRALLAPLALVLATGVLAGCGTDSTSPSADSESTSSTSTDPTDPTDSAGSTDSTDGAESDPDAVVAVSVRRSGGLKGGELDLLFSREGDPPERFDAGDVDAVLAAAQAVVDDDVEVPKLPANTCCDRYTHVIVVSLADGSSLTYTTLDGMRLPPEMTALLRAAA